MMTKIKKILISISVFLLLFLHFNCNSKIKDEHFYFPNGEIIKSTTIEDFGKQFELKFIPYEGLLFNYPANNGDIKGILLTKLNINSNPINDIYNNRFLGFTDVYEQLKDESILEIKFDNYVPEGKYFWDSIIISKYKNLGIKMVETKNKKNIIEYRVNNQLFLKATFKNNDSTLVNFKLYPIEHL